MTLQELKEWIDSYSAEIALLLAETADLSPKTIAVIEVKPEQVGEILSIKDHVITKSIARTVTHRVRAILLNELAKHAGGKASE